MQEWRQTLGLSEDAWDVYILYDGSAKWTGDLPPKPSFWMHQLDGVDEKRMLDPDVFASHANALVHIP